MKLRYKIISLIIVMAMMVAAAIVTNKAILGHKVINHTKSSSPSVTNVSAIESIGDDRFIIHTAELPGTITGYAGPVPLDIFISNGIVDSIIPLDNTETPGFFRRTLPLLENWRGKSVAEAANMKVDAVTGATFSSQAIFSNVEIGLDYYLNNTSHEATNKNSVGNSSASSMPIKIWIAFLVTLTACFVPLFVKNKTYHIVQLIANVVVLGFWCGQFLDYAIILRFMSSGFSFPIALVAVLMLIAAFIYPLFNRPQHYCTHICPLGSAQQLLGMTNKNKIRLGVKAIKSLNWFRKILWGALMLMLWADCWANWIDYELFQAFQIKSAPLWIIIIAGIFLILSIFVNRPYCRFVCPTGSLFKRAENID